MTTQSFMSSTVFQVQSRSVQSYAGLAELVGPGEGEVVHIWISDGRVLALRVYSILPGSESKTKERAVIVCY